MLNYFWRYLKNILECGKYTVMMMIVTSVCYCYKVRKLFQSYTIKALERYFVIVLQILRIRRKIINCMYVPIPGTVTETEKVFYLKGE